MTITRTPLGFATAALVAAPSIAAGSASATSPPVARKAARVALRARDSVAR